MLKNNVICGLDIGTTKVACAVAKVTPDGKFQNLTLYKVESQAFRDGRINDLAALSNSIQEVVELAGEKSKLRINSCFVGVDSPNTMIQESKAAILISKKGDEVTYRDLQRVRRQARDLASCLDREVVLASDIDWQLDGQGNIRNPVGLFGSKLEVRLLCVLVPRSLRMNLIKAVDQAGLEVESIVPGGYAASLVALDQQQRQGGWLLLDIGGDISSLLLFRAGTLRKVEITRWGGNHLTRLISEKLKLPLKLAEELKRSYAVALSRMAREEEKVLLKGAQDYHQISRYDISQAIEPQLRSFLSGLRDRLNKYRWLQDCSSIVVTGGGSFVDGLLEMIQEIFGIPAKIGLVQEERLSAFERLSFTTSLGLVCWGLRKRQARYPLSSSKDRFRNLYLGFKELFRDYF
jgi:cell division protein FtsA